MNQQTLSGQWRQLRGKLQEKWGELTDDELDHVEGNVDQLIGLVQQKTGETREEIESYVDQICESCDGQSVTQRVSETAREYAGQAVETAQGAAQSAVASMQHSSEFVTDRVKEGYQQTQSLVRHRPVESLAVTFGAGLIAGVVVGLVLRSR